MLTKDEVRKIAHLARISLTEAELEKFSKDLSLILDYVAELQSINVDGVEEISQVTGLVNVQRKDESKVTEVRQEILTCAPETKDDYIKVKAIL